MANFQHILIVEDDGNVRELLRECLEELGYRVSTAGRGDAARLILNRRDVDVLLADELMAGEKGHQLAAYAQSLGVPSLLMSAHNEVKRELSGGEHAFIGKPFRIDKLHEEVKWVLARAKSAAGGG